MVPWYKNIISLTVHTSNRRQKSSFPSPLNFQKSYQKWSELSTPRFFDIIENFMHSNSLLSPSSLLQYVCSNSDLEIDSPILPKTKRARSDRKQSTILIFREIPVYNSTPHGATGIPQEYIPFPKEVFAFFFLVWKREFQILGGNMYFFFKSRKIFIFFLWY